jgi:hypothetical protein
MLPSEHEPHIDALAKMELEAINDLMVDGRAGNAGVMLGKFLDNVHVIPVYGTTEEIGSQLALRVWREIWRDTIVLLNDMGISPEVAASAFAALLSEKLKETDLDAYSNSSA